MPSDAQVTKMEYKTYVFMYNSSSFEYYYLQFLFLVLFLQSLAIAITVCCMLCVSATRTELTIIIIFPNRKLTYAFVSSSSSCPLLLMFRRSFYSLNQTNPDLLQIKINAT